MDKELYKPFEEKMQKTFEALKNELSHIRAGRANPSVLEKVTISYYGVQTPVVQVGNVNVPEARVIVIQPWDPKLLGEIEKAIQKSDIGINPTNDGKVLRLVFPQLTEERRKELTKVIKKYGEEAKVAIRTIRRDAIEHFKGDKKKSDITEDDLKEMEKDIQIITDKHISDIDKIVELKEKEILEV
jgi:ribosome recycling factor